MSEYYAVIRSSEYLEHHGVKGMKWGVRKQQLVSGAKRFGAAAKPYLQAEIKRRNKKYRNKRGQLRLRKFVGNALVRTGKSIGAGIVTGTAASALVASGHPVAAGVIAKAGATYIASQKYQKYADYGSLVYQEMKNAGYVNRIKKQTANIYNQIRS